MKKFLLSILLTAALVPFAGAQNLPSALAPLRFAGVPTSGTSEVQTVTLAGFGASAVRIAYSGQTASLTFAGTESNATIGASVQAALVALPAVGASGVTVVVTGTTDRSVAITFAGALAALDVPQVTGSLTGTGTFSIATTTPGVTATGRGPNTGTGRLLIDSTNGKLYINTATTNAGNAPVWTVVGSQS